MNKYTVETRILKSFDDHATAFSYVRSNLVDELVHAGRTLANCLDSGNSIFWCGNGGSAADCQHLAAELVGRFKKDRKPLKSIALTTDSSVLTCIANDFDYKEVFSRQLEALGSNGDVLVAITTSGNSQNILNAIAVANSIGMKVILLTGKDGGEATKMQCQSILIPIQETAPIQEMHILIGHILCDLIEHQLGFSDV